MAVNSYHIIYISETWLKPTITDELVKLENYYLIRNDRRLAKGGGVACYIHTSLKTTILQLSPNTTFNEPEYIIFALNDGSHDGILFTSIYRRPKGLLLNAFINCFSNYYPHFKNVLIAGDINCNHLNECFEAQYLRNFAKAHSLHLLGRLPTHHTATSESLLDVFIVDDITKVTLFEKTTCPFIAGHDLLHLHYSYHQTPTTVRLIRRRNFKQLDELQLGNMVHSKINTLLDKSSPNHQLTCDIDLAVQTIQNTIVETLDQLAPTITFFSKKQQPQWMTTEIKNLIITRNRLYKHAKRSRSLLDFQIYRDFRGQLHHKIRQTKHEYFYNKLCTTTDQSTMWRKLVSLGLVKSSKPSPLHFFTCQQLQHYYTTNPPPGPPCSLSDLAKAINNVDVTKPAFSFTPFNVNEVFCMLSTSLSNSFTTGPDKLSPYIIKKLRHSLSPILCAIFNKSIHDSYFPKNWKTAHLKPLSKISTPKSPADTRPIANLCEFSKIFERLLHRQITKHLETTGILDAYQSGFRKKHSTQYALLRLCHDIRKSVDERKITVLVLFDFSKAFDTIQHSKLLCKLAHLGFTDSTLSWVYLYLNNRTQRVIDGITGDISDIAINNFGISQGSVLGPLLFMLFINDISLNLKYCKHIIYADDTQIYCDTAPTDLILALENVAHDAGTISNFARDNGLKLNGYKSKILIMGSSQHINAINYNLLPPIIINGDQIPYVRSTKNLGVIIQSNLSWTKHTTYMSSRVYAVLHRLKTHKNSLPTNLRVSLVVTLIFPIIDYCCVTYNDCTTEIDLRLQRLINATIRFIYNCKRDEHITPYRQQLKWLSVKNR